MRHFSRLLARLHTLSAKWDDMMFLGLVTLLIKTDRLLKLTIYNVSHVINKIRRWGVQFMRCLSDRGWESISILLRLQRSNVYRQARTSNRSPLEPKITHLTPQVPLEPLRGMDGWGKCKRLWAWRLRWSADRKPQTWEFGGFFLSQLSSQITPLHVGQCIKTEWHRPLR